MTISTNGQKDNNVRKEEEEEVAFYGPAVAFFRKQTKKGVVSKGGRGRMKNERDIGRRVLGRSTKMCPPPPPSGSNIPDKRGGKDDISRE